MTSPDAAPSRRRLRPRARASRPRSPRAAPPASGCCPSRAPRTPTRPGASTPAAGRRPPLPRPPAALGRLLSRRDPDPALAGAGAPGGRGAQAGERLGGEDDLDRHLEVGRDPQRQEQARAVLAALQVADRLVVHARARQRAPAGRACARRAASRSGCRRPRCSCYRPQHSPLAPGRQPRPRLPPRHPPQHGRRQWPARAPTTGPARRRPAAAATTRRSRPPPGADGQQRRAHPEPEPVHREHLPDSLQPARQVGDRVEDPGDRAPARRAAA